MTSPVMQLTNVTVTIDNQITILDNLNLTIHAGDFITVLGTNGSGKSTLFNTIAGNQTISSGTLTHHGRDITATSVRQRTQAIARVFQDPKMGTAPRMTVAENLLLSERRGQRRLLKLRGLNAARKQHYATLTRTMGNNLDTRLDTATGELSGGQRQALSFLMATQVTPEVLLLDEHTAALDPKTSEQLMAATNAVVTEHQLTTLMITHQLSDALSYGNRLIILNAGKIVLDVCGPDKAALTESELLTYFTN